MPNRPIFALLITIVLSFPVALLAQVVQTQKFSYPSGSSFLPSLHDYQIDVG
jgi:hypothetical protein